VVALMSKLIDSDEPVALGITLGCRSGVKPDHGFEFRINRTGDSVGYQSSSTDACSIVNMPLDTRPILIRQPLYQYE
jgi:cyanophycinase